MKKVTLCYCIRDNKEMLLGLKKTSIGAGLLNGFGGKVDAGESVEEATVRELREESCLIGRVEDLEHVAKINFFVDRKPFFECFVYLLRAWEGEPAETNEMTPEWFALDNLPYDKMWEDDIHWLPRVLAGEKLQVEAYLNGDNTLEKVSCAPLIVQKENV